MINTALASHKNLKTVQEPIYQEILFHANVWKENLKYSVEFENTLSIIEKFLKDPRCSQYPFIVYGKEGFGKSMIISQVAQKIRHWFKTESTVILRYLGETSSSSNIHQLMESVTKQICLAYKLEIPPEKNFKTLFETLEVFKLTITLVSEKFASSRPVFLLFDGIQNLHPLEESMKALHAIRKFPKHIHLIISSTPYEEREGRYSMSTLLTQDEFSTEIESLSDTGASLLFNKYLSAFDRTLQKNQKEAILKVWTESNRSPFFLNLLVRDALKWNSQFNPENLPKNILSIFTKYVDDIRAKYGPNIVQFTLSFLAISLHSGLSEKVITDLLAMEESCLSDAHINCPEVVKKSIIPPIIWAAIRKLLGPFLKIKYVYNHYIVSLRHDMFSKFVSEKFEIVCSGTDKANISTKATEKSIQLYKRMKSYFSSEGTEYSAPQFTIYTNLDKIIRLSNICKLLMPLTGMEILKSYLYFNFEWLNAELCAIGPFKVVENLISIKNLANSLKENRLLDESDVATIKEIEILKDILKFCCNSLLVSPENLPFEIIGRIGNTEKYPSLKNLKDQALKFAKADKKFFLEPLLPALKAPDEIHQKTFNGPTHLLFVSQDIYMYTMTSKKYLSVYDIETDNLEQKTSIKVEQKESHLIPGKKSNFLVISFFSHLDKVNQLKVWSGDTGINVVDFEFKKEFEAIDISKDEKIIAVCSTTDLSDNKDVKSIIGVDIFSKEIIYKIPINDYHESVSKIILHPQNPNRLISVGTRIKKNILLWNLETSKLIREFNLDCFPEDVFVLGNKVVCGNSICWFGIIDISSFEIKSKNFENLGCYTKVNIAKDGSLIWSAVENKLLSISMDFNISETVSFTSNISTFLLSDNEHYAFVGHQDGRMNICNLKKNQIIYNCSLHSREITSLISLNNMLFSAGLDGLVQKFCLESLNFDTKENETLKEQNSLFTGITDISYVFFSQDQALVCSNSLHLMQLDYEKSKLLYEKYVYIFVYISLNR